MSDYVRNVSGKDCFKVKPKLSFVGYYNTMAIEQRAVSNAAVILPEYMTAPLNQEKFPHMGQVITHMVTSTSYTALEVDEFLASRPRLTMDDPDFDRAKIDMDNLAANSLKREFVDAPFIIHSVGSEGLKDQEKTGLKVKTVVGRFGHGRSFKSTDLIPAKFNESIDLVNDPVEGTDSAMLGEPGAIVVVGLSTKGGMRETPKGIKLMKKIVGPEELQGIIHLDESDTANLAACAKALGIRPEDIDVVGLDGPTRQRNYALRDAVRDFGANWIGISRGDLVPGLKAATRGFENGRLTLSMGIGGYEEGVITAAGAKNGAVMQARAWHDDPEIRQIHGEFLDTHDLVPGKPEHSMVIFSAITSDPWFGISGIEQIDGEKRIHSLVISSVGEQRFIQSIPTHPTTIS